MPLPLAAALPAISTFIARRGITEAIKKYASTYGRKAVMAAGKNRRTVTKAEKTAGRGGNVPTRKPNVQGSKMPGGTRMPPNKLDVKASQAARRKANEAAQMGRGKSRIKKGAGAVGAAGTAYGVGEGVRIGAEGAAPAVKAVAAGERGRKNNAEVERLRRVGQRNAFRQAGERTAKEKAAAKAKADTNAKFDSARKTIKDAVVTKPKGPKTNPTGARTIAASRKAKGTTFTGKDEKQKANVTAEELKASGMSLRDYLNKQQGKTRRTEMKKGGAVKKTTKANKTNKVRGSGIAVRGVRPAKMR
jgi:hypothetical protein